VKSLRARLLLGTTLTMILVLGLLGLAVDAAAHRTLERQFDNTLLSAAHAIASAVEQHGSEIHFEFDPRDFPEFDARPHASYFELWVDGKRTAVSPSLNVRSLSHGMLTIGKAGFQNILLPDNKNGRLAVFPFQPRLEDEDETKYPPKLTAIMVAKETEGLDETLKTLRWMVGGLCAVAIVVCEAALVIVVNRAMRPVNAAARKIESLHETRLASGIEVDGLPQELQPIVEKLNGLLLRLDQAFGRERAFTADVAHELRTPIAALRTTLEVCRSKPRDPAIYAATIDRSLKVIDSMQAVVENLLLLARAESGQLPMTMAHVDFVDLVREAWLPFESRAREKNLVFNWNFPEHFIVSCDAGKIRIVLTNLFDNAVSYTNAEGEIIVRLVERGDTAVEFEIANPGSQITVDEIPRLFERFWRKDQARSQTGLHAGLGLSLCQRLLLLSNSAITAKVQNNWLSMSFVLPRPNSHKT
jgi:two-component system heavy metal sensor histidine kinase CusS